MKKIVHAALILGLVSLFLQPVQAQSVKAGIRFGFNATTFTGKDLYNYKLWPGGLHLGPFLRVGAAGKYRFQAELLFSTKGAKATFDVAGVKTNVFDLPMYLDLPLLYNHKVAGVFYYEVGIQPSLLVTGIQAWLDDNDDGDFEWSTSGYKSLDYAPVLGFGAEFDKTMVGLRATYGLGNVLEKDVSSLLNIDRKNLAFMLTFGFKIKPV